MNKPDFFIVGAAKAGTTSLHHYLNDHQDIFLPENKEPNFFSHEEIARQELYYDSENIESEEEYLSLFKEAPATNICGEASVSYLFYKNCAERIHSFNPEAKIIIMLRNPTSRAFSHYSMDQRLGLVKSDFTDIVMTPEESNSFLHYQQYVELGLYYSQVKRYLDVFPDNQIMVLMMEDLINNPAQVVDDVLTFLGVDSSSTQSSFEKHNKSLSAKNPIIKNLYQNQRIRKGLKAIVPKKIKDAIFKVGFKEAPSSPMEPNTKAHLDQFYKTDILKLEQLLNIDLKHWRE